MGLLKSILEPLVIAVVFTIGTWINRQDVPWFDDLRTPLLKDDDADALERNQQRVNGGEVDQDGETIQSKKRKPNIPTRILARFPFLLEIIYWLLIYWIYQGARAISARTIANHKEIFSKAENHALQILSLEKTLHIAIELTVQKYILQNCPWLMKILAQIYYSHIILGVIFLVYCYTYLSRTQYFKIRRTLALENIIAFIILSIWRCAPPRLLPPEYGFIDILHEKGNNSGSAWTQNKFQLTIAAMPSMHFGNSVFIAFCLVRFSPHRVLGWLSLGWPIAMGVTVVATANHFIMDMIVGVFVIGLAYWFNWVMLGLLPIERALFRLCRVERDVYTPYL